MVKDGAPMDRAMAVYFPEKAKKAEPWVTPIKFDDAPPLPEGVE